MSKGIWKPEEQYILRVKDSEVAERIRKVLREEGENTTKLEIIFDGECNLLERFSGNDLTFGYQNFIHFQNYFVCTIVIVGIFLFCVIFNALIRYWVFLHFERCDCKT